VSPAAAAHVPGIERFWRAANYLTLAMLYLRSNPLAPQTLTSADVKPLILGHWGVCPALNAVYAHTRDLTRRRNRPVSLVIGPGHAGPALLACLFLDGTLEAHDPAFTRDADGLRNLIGSYGSSSGFPTEITATYPGVDYVGGELGPALAFAQGTVMGSPNRLVVCVIGDGELETSIAQASFQGFDLLNPTVDGTILPVINANGYRMGSRSLWATRGTSALGRFLVAHGLTPIVVGPDHTRIAHAFDTAYAALTDRQRRRCPVIVLQTPKGWSAPATFGTTAFVGSHHAHKPTLRRPAQDREELDQVRAWLLSYDPATLFDQAGRPLPEVTTCLPPATLRLGTARGPTSASPAHPPATAGDPPSAFASVRNAVETAGASDPNVFVLSPDELRSNRFTTPTMSTARKHGHLDGNGYSPNSRIIEILNENLCFAWSCGLAAAGRRPILISYEAFAPVFASQADQLLKVLENHRDESQPALHPARAGTRWPSVNVILTSLGWWNTPTHHNPSWVDSLLTRTIASARIYLPVLAHTAHRCIQDMLASTGRLNVLVVNKNPLDRLAARNCRRPDTGELRTWVELASDDGALDQVALVALGDVMAEQALHAKEIINLRSARPVTVVAIEDLSLLHSPDHPDWSILRPLLTGCRTSLWITNGRPHTIRGFLHDLRIDATVLGYIDQDHGDPGLERLHANGVSPTAIAERVLRDRAP
jgi:xylulose-5-phosphate/fructose-6-phosphate phosphoketolase